MKHMYLFSTISYDIVLLYFLCNGLLYVISIFAKIREKKLGELGIFFTDNNEAWEIPAQLRRCFWVE